MMSSVERVERMIHEVNAHPARHLGSVQMAIFIETIEAAEREMAEEILAIVKEDWWPPTDAGGLCRECGSWTPARHKESHGHEDWCKAEQEFHQRRNKIGRIEAIIARYKIPEALENKKGT